LTVQLELRTASKCDRCCEEAIIVTTPEIAAVRDADRVVGLLEAHGIKRIHLIVNRLRPAMVEVNNMMSVQDVQEILAIPLIGVVLRMSTSSSLPIAANLWY